MKYLNPTKTVFLAAISVVLAIAIIVVIMALSVIAARESPQSFAQAWSEHRKRSLQLPEDSYHHDRARAVRGFVYGPDGKPLSGCLVQCVRMPSLLQLAQVDTPTPALWSGLVETETRTDSIGRYEFPHLSEGARMLCASAPELAPDVQGIVVTLDGSGARVDFNLDVPSTLRIRLNDADDRLRRVHLVPYRWWPELPWRDVAPGEREVEFSGIGGPFKKGLVIVSEPRNDSGWEPKAAFDLDISSDIDVPATAAYVASPRDVPEAESLAIWGKGTSEAKRQFFSMLTPVALFWRTDPSSQIGVAEDTVGHGQAVLGKNGGLHGFGPNAFLPVLIESHDGRAWLQWTSEASEFELADVPAGLCRVRSLNSFGQVSFVRGLVVPPSEIADLTSSLSNPIKFDDPLSREMMGTVRLEDGRPAEGAQVFLQDSMDFRRFIQRTEADSNGFFSIPNVPSGQYVAFALPPKDEKAMKSFVYPVIDEMRREKWVDFILWPHSVAGQLPEAQSVTRVDLLRRDSEGHTRIVWSVKPAEDGTFEITNVPHGRYSVRAVGGGADGDIESLTFVVENDTLTTVRWAD